MDLNFARELLDIPDGWECAPVTSHHDDKMICYYAVFCKGEYKIYLSCSELNSHQPFADLFIGGLYYGSHGSVQAAIAALRLLRAQP